MRKARKQVARGGRRNDPIDHALAQERQVLARGVRHQRRVRQLATQLRRATAAAFAALDKVGEFLAAIGVHTSRDERSDAGPRE